jgi:integrase
MRLNQYSSLLQGYATSSNFKTVGSFLCQPVTISENARELLQVYVNKVRPRGSQSEFLFLTFHGDHNNRLGRLTTQYFSEKIGLKITTTALRSLVATEAAILHKKGTISDEQFQSLHTISGHSDRIAREYYIKESISANVSNGKEAFKILKDSGGILYT